MAKFGKWIAGSLGWAFLGPIGGLIGFALGSMVDGQDDDFNQGIIRPGTTTQGDFITSLIVLMAAVMKSDGRVLKSELDFLKEFFIRSFGLEQAQQATLLLRKVLDQNIPVEEVSSQIRQRMDYSTRLELIHLLFGISKADGLVSAEELKTVERIAYYMGIKTEDFNSIKALFSDNLESAFAALEISPDATDEEIKKAYRKMAVKYHPDKVAYLGDDLKAQANEKFQQLNAAYEKIKKARGLN
ncbi:MAG: molecular chaperone DnaJ [Porphyromonadaceae bacterium]|nr:MAG: molecular chaperone DnaJ [Porphyromonadaceae bacterium]